ncbi:hypothetical protein F511_27411 [Dorcoceras hygrometricum]|uniref:Uncharacterized protein n=1 Tax=Dorcoceras hygrometricum TaxID=472368 RepID=A0A2Z7DB72_9LAMI|nr:hypothetical protein F511_27411 [Dorcoceras hygrometricum]
MHWRDNMYTLTPRTPDRSPKLASFLDAMREKRMGKAEMLKMMEEDAAAGSSGAAVPAKKGPKKRRASTQPDKEARHKNKKKKEAPTRAGRRRLRSVPPRIVPSPPWSSPLLKPLPRRKRGPGNGMGGEVVRRLTRAHRAVKTTRRSFDEAMGQHAELLARLDELEALRAREQQAAEAREEALEDQLAAEKAARQATKSELDAALAKKTAVKVELEETKALTEEEVGRLKSDVIHAWDRSKEEFLQSSEFDTLCTERSLRYFKDGFAGCLAQFQDNGYSEEEHPASFLDAKKALMGLPDEEVEEEEEEEEGEVSRDEGTPPSSPK